MSETSIDRQDRAPNRYKPDEMKRKMARDALTCQMQSRQYTAASREPESGQWLEAVERLCDTQLQVIWPA